MLPLQLTEKAEKLMRPSFRVSASLELRIERIRRLNRDLSREHTDTHTDTQTNFCRLVYRKSKKFWKYGSPFDNKVNVKGRGVVLGERYMWNKMSQALLMHSGVRFDIDEYSTVR